MTRPPKKDRNKQIVWLRRHDPDHYTVRAIGAIFDLKESTVHEILTRDYDKYPLPDWYPRYIEELSTS